MPEQPLIPSVDTYQAIMDVFCKQVRKTSIAQVRVTELIKRLGISRNTFYYYFDNKYEVAYHVFRIDLDKRLRSAVPGANLLTETFDDDPCQGLAYYAHGYTDEHVLSHSQFITCLAQCINDDKQLYRKLFTLKDSEFIHYVVSIWSIAAKSDLEIMLEKRKMEPVYQDLLINKEVWGIISTISFTFAQSKNIDILCDPVLNPYQNVLLEDLYHSVERYFNARKGQRTGRNQRAF